MITRARLYTVIFWSVAAVTALLLIALILQTRYLQTYVATKQRDIDGTRAELVRTSHNLAEIDTALKKKERALAAAQANLELAQQRLKDLNAKEEATGNTLEKVRAQLAAEKLALEERIADLKKQLKQANDAADERDRRLHTVNEHNRNLTATNGRLCEAARGADKRLHTSNGRADSVTKSFITQMLAVCGNG